MRLAHDATERPSPWNERIGFVLATVALVTLAVLKGLGVV
jgi:hypothetical protein